MTHVLVVDDQKPLRTSLAITLRRAGFSVDEAGSGEEAIERIDDTLYDLVITDLRMDPVGGRKRYMVSVAGDEDPRPEIFRLAKKRDWVLWELHEETARLEDVFHSLTADGYDEEN